LPRTADELYKHTSKAARASIAQEDLLHRLISICLAVYHIYSTFSDYYDMTQGVGGLLIRKYDGDFWNVVGFPAASFFKLIELIIEEDEDFLGD